MNDERYAYGTICTWHGPLTFAEPANGENEENGFVCPKCGDTLTDIPVLDFWLLVQSTGRSSNRPEYEAMMRWSEGQCYPDFDTMQNAYRQAMEGHN